MASRILSELLAYDPTSGSGLRWKVTASNRAPAGSEAGCILKAGRTSAYYVVRVNKKLMLAHRVIWELVHGEPVPDDMDIDHIDGDGLNNSVENMRVVPRVMNLRNQQMSRLNKSGVPGVRRTTRPRDLAYVAYFNDLDGRARYKHYSIRKYGEDEALRLATAWRMARIAEVNAKGAGYTDRHLVGG